MNYDGYGYAAPAPNSAAGHAAGHYTASSPAQAGCYTGHGAATPFHPGMQPGMQYQQNSNSPSYPSCGGDQMEGTLPPL